MYSTPGVTETEEKLGKARAHTQVGPDEFGPSEPHQTLTGLTRLCLRTVSLRNLFPRLRERQKSDDLLSAFPLSPSLRPCCQNVLYSSTQTLPGSLPRLDPMCQTNDWLHLFSNNKLSAGSMHHVVDVEVR